MTSPKLSVSIIVPNYNGTALLEQNLPHIIFAAKGAQIIVVDDASTDSSLKVLNHKFPSVKTVVHSHNRRFAAACNTGVKHATGAIIILLNTDVIPTKDFLKALVQPFTDPLVFAVGCSEINRPEKAIVSGRSCGYFYRGLFLHRRCPDQSKATSLWASGGSGAFRRSMWLKLGGMDTLFAPAYEEDRDICYRALKRGWSVLFAPDSRVYHHHEQTNRSVFSSTAVDRASYKNHLIFCWKNLTQPKYIITHIFWLPYHLIITSIRSRGQFLFGFLQALSRLPQIIKLRRIEVHASTLSDETILQRHQS